MKKLFMGLLLCSAVMAQSKGEYSISLVGMKMDYREYDRVGILLDSEKSNFSDITGAEFAYRFFLDENTNIEVKFFGVSGETEYVGSYIGSGAGYGSVVSRTSNDVRDLCIGYNAANMTNYGVAMLGGVGLGYRYWQRSLSATQVELYEWYSLRARVGMRFYYDNWTTSLLAEYQYGIKPTMTATGIAEDFKLSSADIIKFSIPIRYTISQMVDISCSYVFEYQEIKESNVVYDSTGTGYVEPDSKAYNQYVTLGIIFKY